jgi:hypothetical protein
MLLHPGMEVHTIIPQSHPPLNGVLTHAELQPEEKHLDILEKLTLFSSHPSTSLKDLHSLVGSLSHAAIIVPEGRVNLHGLWSMLSAMVKAGGSQHQEVILPGRVSRELGRTREN